MLDDTSVTFHQHIVQYLFSYVEKAIQTNVQYVPPLVAVHPEQQVIFTDAGIIHQHLDLFFLYYFPPSHRVTAVTSSLLPTLNCNNSPLLPLALTASSVSLLRLHCLLSSIIT